MQCPTCFADVEPKSAACSICGQKFLRAAAGAEPPLAARAATPTDMLPSEGIEGPSRIPRRPVSGYAPTRQRRGWFARVAGWFGLSG